LWQLRDNAADRQSLSEEILTMILDREWFDRATGSQGSMSLSPELIKEAKIISALYIMYTNTNQEEIKQIIDEYCQSKRLYTYYVLGLKNLYWLAPASASLYAREKGINLCIWRPGKQENELVLERRVESVSGPTMHLFHKPNFNHFDRLEPIPEPSLEHPASSLVIRGMLQCLEKPPALQSLAAKSVKSDTSSGWEF
jgi:hypothetical protein